MDTTTKIILAVVGVIVVGAGALWLSMSKDNGSTRNQGDSSVSQNETPEMNDDTTVVASTITYTNRGFSVSNDTIKAGDGVRVVNDSDDVLDFSSDPHPVHTDNSELNAGDIPAGKSQTFVIDKKGTWGFHNHLNDNHEGEITVE